MGLPFENADYNEDEVGARKIPELTDVVLTNIQNDNVLVYNNGIWENQAQSGGSSITELDDIPGVTITNAQDNQFLKYISGVWVNSTDTDANTDNLNDLTDTLLTTPFGDDEVLKYSGGKWKNGNIPIEKLSNVHISNLQDGETLRYIHQNARWENAYNIDTLNELSDVTISSNLNNHVLKYNNSLGVYKNAYLNVTDLGDTNITTLANGNTLIYNNGVWSAGNIPLSNFTNGTGISVTGTSPNFTITNTAPDETVTLNNGTGISVTGNYPTFTITNTYQETDPVFTAHVANGITSILIGRWNSAFGWGDHSTQNYLNTSSPAGSITNGTGFLKNNGSGTWSYDTNNYTYTNGTGVSINSNVISIGQSVATSGSPSFTQMSLGNTGVNQGILNLQDFTNIGTDTVAQIKGIKEGTNGGDLRLLTKVDGGSVTEKLRINNVGAIGIGGTDYGDEYNILQSKGSGNPPEWTNTLNVESIYAGNTTSNTVSSFTRVLVKMIQSIFKFYDIAENILATISSVADGAGGKLRFYTTNATSGLEVINLTIKESGAFGLGNLENCGTAGQVLSSNGSGSAVSWTTPTAPPPGAFGVFYVDGALTIPVNTGQQVNNLVRDTRFPLTGMSILGKQTGNTAQTITVSGGAGNYLFTWTINAQQLSGSTNNVFELYQGGSRLNYNWYIFSGLENIVGSFMVNQTTASADYSFLATATGGGHYRLNGFNNQWTQISITKLF